MWIKEWGQVKPSLLLSKECNVSQECNVFAPQNIREPLIDKNNIEGVILANYGLRVDKVEKINRGMMSNSYKVFAGTKQYFLKEPLTEISEDSMNEEVHFTHFLKDQSVPVADFVKTLDGRWSFKHQDRYISMQEYIEGRQYRIFELPDNFFLLSLETLGRIDKSLQDYELQVKKRWNTQYCERYDEEKIVHELKSLIKTIDTLSLDAGRKADLKQAAKHIMELQLRVRKFGQYLKYVTHARTHGDYHAGNIIYGTDEILAVIDNNEPLQIPATNNLISFYIKAANECAMADNINVARLASSLRVYTKYAPLTYCDYKFAIYVYLYILVGTLPKRMHRCVQYSKGGNGRLTRGSIKGLVWNVNLCRYLNANADIISQKLEKYYESTLDKDELKKHRKWLKGQEHVKGLHAQESAIRRRRIFRKVVPLAVRRAGKRILSAGLGRK